MLTQAAFGIIRGDIDSNIQVIKTAVQTEHVRAHLPVGAAPGHFAASFPASGAASTGAAVLDTLSDKGRDRAR